MREAFFAIEPATLEDKEQHDGRIGRVCDGWIARLPTDTPKPEARFQLPYQDTLSVVVQGLALGSNFPIVGVSSGSRREAQEDLVSLGLCTFGSDGDGNWPFTEFGVEASRETFTPQLATFYATAKLLGVPMQGQVAGAFISTGRDLFQNLTNGIVPHLTTLTNTSIWGPRYLPVTTKRMLQSLAAKPQWMPKLKLRRLAQISLPRRKEC